MSGLQPNCAQGASNINVIIGIDISYFCTQWTPLLMARGTHHVVLGLRVGTRSQ